MPERGIDYFGRSPFAGIEARASLRIRRQIYEWFSEAIGGVEGKVILDHGSTPNTSRSANCFIRWLLADRATVYAASPEDIAHLPADFPGLNVIPWPPTGVAGRPFEAVVSSAVIEHVGAREVQLAYLTDVLQLGERVLLTTPNRRHWLEFHTKLPLIHWLPKDRHRALLSRIGMTLWAREQNLNLLTREELEALISEAASRVGVAASSQWYEPQFLGQVSNLVALVTRSR